MTETNTYSPEQRDNMKQRALHDAKLLEAGADFNERGVLVPTANQQEAMTRTFTAELKEQFYKETPEGQQIEAHVGILREMANLLNSSMGNVAIHKSGERHSLPEYAPWLKANGVDVDIDALSRTHPNDSPESAQLYRDALLKVGGSSADLHELADTLIQYPQFGIGNEVTVARNGKDGSPSYLEAGWKVESVQGDAKLIVTSDTEQGKLAKAVSTDQLRAWSQPRTK